MKSKKVEYKRFSPGDIVMPVIKGPIDWETDFVTKDNLVIGRNYVVEEYNEEDSVFQCYVRLKGCRYNHSPNKFELVKSYTRTFQHAAGVGNIEPKVEIFRDDKTSQIDPLIGAFRKTRRTE